MVVLTGGASRNVGLRRVVPILLMAAAVLPPGAAVAAGLQDGQQERGRAHWLKLAEQQDKEADVPADPNLTTASYGDWVLRCERSRQPSRSRVCDVAQTVPTQDLQGALAQISIARQDGSGPLHIYGLLPANIALPGSATMRDEDGTLELELQWRRCLPSGCLSEAQPSEPVLDRWKKRTGSGQIVYKDAGGSDVTVPVSFRGLRQALDALAKEQ